MARPGGTRPPRVRLAVLRGELSPEALAPASDWPALHATYPEVLAKLKANTASLPATAPCADSAQAATPAAIQADPGASQD